MKITKEQINNNISEISDITSKIVEKNNFSQEEISEFETAVDNIEELVPDLHSLLIGLILGSGSIIDDDDNTFFCLVYFILKRLENK